jgi:hypothetical protein
MPTARGCVWAGVAGSIPYRIVATWVTALWETRYAPRTKAIATSACQGEGVVVFGGFALRR